jgi:ubiquinone/menaquinone biosynthesis C-methylase UbiE/DNA-directed RNA polymerase subunit E'/Rpb7
MSSSLVNKYNIDFEKEPESKRETKYNKNIKQSKRNISIYMKNILIKQILVPLHKIGSNLKYILENILSSQIGGKCIQEGYIKPGSIKIITYSNGNIIGNDIIFKVVFECLVCSPVEGMHINAIVKNITKAGIRAELIGDESPVIIFIVRDHHYKMPYFTTLKENDKIKVKVIGQRFELQDTYISIIAELIEPYYAKKRGPRIVLTPEDYEDDESINEDESKYQSKQETISKKIDKSLEKESEKIQSEVKTREKPKFKIKFKETEEFGEEKETIYISGSLFANIFKQSSYSKGYNTFIKTFKKGFQGYKVGNLPEKILNDLIEVVSSGKSDNQIFSWLNRIMNEEVYSKYGIKDKEGRGKHRADEINGLLQLINFTPTNLLDFGAGDVNITYHLADIKNISRDKVFISDIKEPSNTYGFNFIKSNPDNPRINMEDNSVDFITSLMVLHHVKDPISTIQEFYRILRPGGYLLIREHDNEDSVGYLVEALDMLHGFYEAVWDVPEKLENPEFPNKYYSSYKSNDEWTRDITNVGFERINSPDELENAYLTGSEDDYKRKINPYAFYYAIYKKSE